MTMSPAQLREAWSAAGFGPVPNLATNILRRLLAQQLQERRHGRLPALVARELERSSQRRGAVPRPSPRTALTPGTRLIREWQGRTIAVEVTETGFVWDDKNWRSLSEIACEVTGAHWSGPGFFGLNRRG